MIYHIHLTNQQLWRQLHQQTIRFAGNNKLKIYGTLHCTSGKRMKKENRVFFHTEKEALRHGFRPCAHCMKATYKKWKHEFIR